MSRTDALEEAAKLADMFAEECFAMAQDTILLDPVLSGKSLAEEAIKRSYGLQTEGLIYSSRAHAAQNIAAAIRELKKEKADA